MWETRNDDGEHAGLRGKFLAVLPLDAAEKADRRFFSKTPQRQTAAVKATIVPTTLAN